MGRPEAVAQIQVLSWVVMPRTAIESAIQGLSFEYFGPPALVAAFMVVISLTASE